MHIIDQDTATRMLKGFVIPPRPDVLARFQQECGRPTPSLKRLADIVSVDPGISASLLRTVNSPLFGHGRKIVSVHEAANLLGMVSLRHIVTSLALITAQGQPVGLERFWDTAMDVAAIARALARNVPGIAPDDAYLLGMFHDCGIALLAQRLPDYKAFLHEANRHETRSLTDMEEERYHTNHASVGFLVAKSWELPKHICAAIQIHHERLDFRSNPPGMDARVLPLLALLKMASHLSHVNRGIDEADDWLYVRNPILEYLGISGEEFGEIEHEMRENSRVTPQLWVTRAFEEGAASGAHRPPPAG